ncbi:hypothetical protein HDU76_004060, partial [Blyttiomyces sp. JEL0837]
MESTEEGKPEKAESTNITSVKTPEDRIDEDKKSKVWKDVFRSMSRSKVDINTEGLSEGTPPPMPELASLRSKSWYRKQRSSEEEETSTGSILEIVEKTHDQNLPSPLRLSKRDLKSKSTIALSSAHVKVQLNPSAVGGVTNQVKWYCLDETEVRFDVATKAGKGVCQLDEGKLKFIVDIGNLSEEEKRRQEVIYELIMTEREDKGIVPVKQVNVIFSNIEQLLPVNQELLKRLESRRKDSFGIVSEIGDIFLDVAQYLKMYTQYCGNQPEAIEYLKSQKQNTQLTVFLQEILRHTGEGHPDFKNLKSSSELINNVVDAVNERRRFVENQQKLISALSKLDFDSAFLKGKMPVTKVLSVEKCEVADFADTEKYHSAFEVVFEGKKHYYFMARNMEEKRAWISWFEDGGKTGGAGAVTSARVSTIGEATSPIFTSPIFGFRTHQLPTSNYRNGANMPRPYSAHVDNRDVQAIPSIVVPTETGEWSTAKRRQHVRRSLSLSDIDARGMFENGIGVNSTKRDQMQSSVNTSMITFQTEAESPDRRSRSSTIPSRPSALFKDGVSLSPTRYLLSSMTSEHSDIMQTTSIETGSIAIVVTEAEKMSTNDRVPTIKESNISNSDRHHLREQPGGDDYVWHKRMQSLSSTTAEDGNPKKDDDGSILSYASEEEFEEVNISTRALKSNLSHTTPPNLSNDENGPPSKINDLISSSRKEQESDSQSQEALIQESPPWQQSCDLVHSTSSASAFDRSVNLMVVADEKSREGSSLEVTSTRSPVTEVINQDSREQDNEIALPDVFKSDVGGAIMKSDEPVTVFAHASVDTTITTIAVQQTSDTPPISALPIETVEPDISPSSSVSDPIRYLNSRLHKPSPPPKPINLRGYVVKAATKHLDSVFYQQYSGKIVETADKGVQTCFESVSTNPTSGQNADAIAPTSRNDNKPMHNSPQSHTSATEPCLQEQLLPKTTIMNSLTPVKHDEVTKLLSESVKTLKIVIPQTRPDSTSPAISPLSPKSAPPSRPRPSSIPRRSRSSSVNSQNQLSQPTAQNVASLSVCNGDTSNERFGCLFGEPIQSPTDCMIPHTQTKASTNIVTPNSPFSSMQRPSSIPRRSRSPSCSSTNLLTQRMSQSSASFGKASVDPKSLVQALSISPKPSRIPQFKRESKVSYSPTNLTFDKPDTAKRMEVGCFEIPEEQSDAVDLPVCGEQEVKSRRSRVQSVQPRSSHNLRGMIHNQGRSRSVSDGPARSSNTVKPVAAQSGSSEVETRSKVIIPSPSTSRRGSNLSQNSHSRRTSAGRTSQNFKAKQLAKPTIFSEQEIVEMSYQAVDQKKEDFRKYLEKNGIIDALTKVLVGLYEEPEKPENPVDFIKQFLGGPSDIDVEALKHENEELRKRVEEMQARIEELSNT